MGSSVKGQPEAENRGTDNAMAKWKKIKKTKYDIKYTKQNKKYLINANFTKPVVTPGVPKGKLFLFH